VPDDCIAELESDPEFRKALEKYRKFHGCDPKELLFVEFDYPVPEFQIVLGESPEAMYQVPGYSRKAGKENLPYRHEFENPVLLVTDASGRFLSHVPLTKKTVVTDWIHG
jgi:hypothetical protein